jgi:hypothetical protein
MKSLVEIDDKGYLILRGVSLLSYVYIDNKDCCWLCDNQIAGFNRSGVVVQVAAEALVPYKRTLSVTLGGGVVVYHDKIMIKADVRVSNLGIFITEIHEFELVPEVMYPTVVNPWKESGGLNTG